MMIDDIRTVLNNPTIILCEPFYLKLNSCNNPYKNTPYVECESKFEPLYIKQSDNYMELFRKELTYIGGKLD